jgi:cold shock CspA family protein
MKGTVKFYKDDKGYGFIATDGLGDLFFHISDVIGAKPPARGDRVEFEGGFGVRGRPVAKSVAIIGNEFRPTANSVSINRTEGGKQGSSRQPPSPKGAYVEVTRDVCVDVHCKDEGTALMHRTGGGVLGGAVGGAAGGPVGMLVGATIGALLGGVPSTKTVERTARIEITATCLRCGGTGHVTAETDRFFGFQCGSCNRFWKAFDPQKIREEALENARITVKKEDWIAENKLYAAAESARRRKPKWPRG